MEDLHIVTVATKSEYYFPYLKESCKRHGKELTVLGYGQKWTGFTMKFRLMIDYLKKLKSSDIVCFIDGYDVICTRNLNELKDEFIKLKNNTNYKIIVGHDKIYNNSFFSYLLTSLYFGKCKNIKLNSGTYIGYVKDLLDMLISIYDGNNTIDDQIILTKYCNQTDNIYIDVESKLFLSIGKGNSDINDYFKFNYNNIIYNNNRPFFLHAPGNTYLENTLKLLNYDVPNNNIQKLMYKRYFYRISNIITHNIFFIISLILIILFIVKFKIYKFI